MADNDLQTTLSITPDDSGAKRTIKTVNAIEDSIADLTHAIKENAKVSGSVTGQLVKNYQAAKNAAIAAAKEQANAQNLAGRIQGATGGLRGLASAAGAGGVSEALNIGSDIAGLAEELPKLKESLAGLPDAVKSAAADIGLAGGVLGIGLAGLAGAILLIKSASDAARQEIEKQIAAAQDYNAIVARETQDSIDKRLEEAKVTTETARLNVETAQKAADEAYDAYLNAGNIFDTNKFYDQYSAATAVLETNLETLNKATSNERDLQRAREDSRVVTRTLQQHEEELAKERQKVVDQLVSTEISTLQKAQQMNSTQAKERLKAIADETAAIERYINSAGQSEEGRKALQQRLDNLATEYTLLQTLLPTLIAHNDALEEQKRIEDATIEATKNYTEEVAKIEQDNLEKRAALAKSYGDKIEQIAQAAVDAAANALRELEQRKADLARDLARAGEEADIQAARDAIDLQIKAQREELKALRNYQDEVKRINKEANRSSLVATQDRDAVALAAAEDQRNNALSDAKDQLDIDRRERNIANAEALDDQRTQYARERDDRLRKFNQDLADAQAAYAADLAQAQTKRQQDLLRAKQSYDADIAQQNTAHIQKLTAARNAAIQEITLAQRTNAQILASDTATRNQQLALARQLLAGIASSTAASAIPLTGGVGNHSYPTPPSLDAGGQITRTGMALVHRGESIVNPARGQSAGGVTVNINGVQMKEINARSKQHAIDTVVGALKEML